MNAKSRAALLAADALQQQRLSQIRRAFRARMRGALTKRATANLFVERDRQIRLTEQAHTRSVAAIKRAAAKRTAARKAARKAPAKKVSHAKTAPVKKVSHAKTPPAKKVSHAKTAPRVKTVSRFWQHFARDGRPIPPWEISVGPGLDTVDEGGPFEGSYFAEGGYDYEDFDTDWGGYAYEDTGYDDEDA